MLKYLFMSGYIEGLNRVWDKLPVDRKKILHDLDWSDAIKENHARQNKSLMVQDRVRVIVQLLSWTDFKKTEEEVRAFLGITEETLSFDKFLLSPIESLELIMRTQNVLHRMNIRYVGELVQSTEVELLNTNIGRHGLEEIKNVLSIYGLSLWIKVQNWHSQNNPIFASVKTLAIPEKFLRSLDENNIFLIGDLTLCAEADLLRMNGIGPFSVNLIKDALAQVWLSLNNNKRLY